MAEGLANTAEGDFFWVAHETGEDVLTLYRVVDGDAELWAALPRGDVVREAAARAEAAAESAEEDAQAAQDALDAILALGDLPSAVAAAEAAAQSASDSATAAATSESTASAAATAAEQAAQRAEDAAADTGLPSPIVPDTFLQAKADGSGYDGKTPEQVADILRLIMPPRGHIAGLRVSNNAADPATAIDIAPGEAADSTATYLLRLESTLTKRLDAAWAQGSGQGGLFSGSKAPETTYYLFLIRRDSDGAIDAGFDTDPNAANRPAGWSAYAPVWELAVHTDDSGNLWQFEHNGNGAIIFPGGGSAASPGNVTINTRYVVPSPYPGYHLSLRAELLYAGKWVTTGAALAANTVLQSGGVLVGQEDDEIVVRTGTTALLTANQGALLSTAESVASNQTTLPCRVKAWKVKGAL